MRLGTLARRPARFLTPCCERVPVHVQDAKYVCPVCGTICYDPVTLTVQAFGGQVERCITTRDTSEPIIFDGWIERWLDA